MSTLDGAFEKIRREIPNVDPDTLVEAAYAIASKCPMYVIPNTSEHRYVTMSGMAEFYITSSDGDSHTYGTIEAAAERVAELHWEEDHTPESAPVCILVPLPFHRYWKMYEGFVEQLREEYEDD